MISKPKKYDEIEVNDFDFVPLELGGHKGIIKNVYQYESKFSYTTSLRVEVDTDKTDKQPGYFQEQFDNNTDKDKKWSNGAIKYVSLKEDDNCVKMLKAFITAVENSNPNFVYDWNKEESQLIGKKVGLIFGLEEYQDNEGKIKTATKLTQFRSLDKVSEAKIPKVKLLDNTFVDYEEYKNSNENKTTPIVEENVIEITGDMLPF